MRQSLTQSQTRKPSWRFCPTKNRWIYVHLLLIAGALWVLCSLWSSENLEFVPEFSVVRSRLVQTPPPDTKCEMVHICILCIDQKGAKRASILVKSILKFRSRPVTLHLMTDDAARKIMDNLLRSWDLPDIFWQFIFWPQEPWSSPQEDSCIPENMELHTQLPDQVEKNVKRAPGQTCTLVTMVENERRDWFKRYKAIVLQPHHVVFSDIYDIWQQFRNFGKTQIFASSEDNLVISRINGELRTSQALLMNLTLIRQTPAELRDFERQSSINTDINRQSTIPGKENSDLNQRAMSVDVMNTLLMTVLEYNGNRARYHLRQCFPRPARPVAVQDFYMEDCEKYNNEEKHLYRTHVNYLGNTSSASVGEITLVSQFSQERFGNLERLLIHWSGPVSLAVYLSDAEVLLLEELIESSPLLRARDNVMYHIVYKDKYLHPINYLRNVALNYSTTHYVFLSDFDFIPMYDIHNTLKAHVKNIGKDGIRKKALVVAAFESMQGFKYAPRSKAELIPFVENGDILPFHIGIIRQGHGATNFSYWYNSTDIYQIEWEESFEPYVVVDKYAPRYDERFHGYGYDKVSHVMELYARGYEFHVLPDVFLVHAPHGDSIYRKVMESDLLFRKCRHQLTIQFYSKLIELYKVEADVFDFETKLLTLPPSPHP